MFYKLGKLTQSKILVRCMTSTEVSTALRPFYFIVHPDLFGQHPNQRAMNENSLQQLSSFFETLQTKNLCKPCILQFYMRHKNQKDSFRLIKIHLKEKDVRQAVLTVLKSCELPTEYVDKIPCAAPSKMRLPDIDYSNISSEDPIFGPIVMAKKINEYKETFHLKEWLKENHEIAATKSESFKPIRDEIVRLQNVFREKWGLLDVRWDCDWNEIHFRGCLQSLQILAQQHPLQMNKLKGRLLVFASFTGVSLDGHIMLFNGEVRHNWLDLIKNIKKYDMILLRIPAFEKSVSQVLRDIKVVRRQFMPKIKAGEYENHLQQITTSLGDYLGQNSFPKSWPESLHDYQIVVESEAGPLMVSPVGQFIVPASCPGTLLVNFITENMAAAKERMQIYEKNKHVETKLHDECVLQLQLEELCKDDNVSQDIMIRCCENLLSHKNDLLDLKGKHLTIATYYSVLADGVLCIPWNWKL